jgi:uncharacterized membrane protein
MAEFLTALAVFIVSHAVPAAPPIRRGLVARFGMAAFLVGYSMLSAVLFTWLIRAALRAPYVEVWPPVPAAYALAVVGVPLALVLLGAGILSPNPLSVSLAPGEYSPERPGAVAFTRHPILWGLGLWGLAHVPANGDVVALVMFGGLGLFALVGMLVMDVRKRASLGPQAWSALAAGTSFLPFVALLTGRARWPRDGRTLAGAAAGAALAALLLGGLHIWLFQRDPLAFF